MISSDTYCCCACVGDPFLKAQIVAEGEIAECAQCHETREAVTEFALGQWIEAVLQAHFHPGAGDSLEAIVEEIAGLSPELAEEIASSLASLAGYIASGGPTFYDSDEYSLARNTGGESEWRWQRFTETVRAEARYFNRTAEAWLDHIFGPLGDDRTWHGKEVFKVMAPGEPGAGFYRARHVSSVAKAWEILGCPSVLLGPLPMGQGAAGRMNAAGVSVFYGALDVDTCVGEIRPPVGSIVLSARFDLVRPVRLLDFDLLEEIEARCSHFDPDYDQKQERAAFLRAFGRRIAQPVMPDDEAFGYLPTQIVADYLAQRLDPAIDGMLYRSTQTGGKGRNVVLFNRTSRVERHDVAHPAQPLRDFPPGPLDALLDDAPAPIPREWPPLDGNDNRDVTLRIAMDSVQVSDIRATTYEEIRRSAEMWQLDLEERDRGFD